MRIAIVLLCVLSASPAFAQIESCPFFKRQIDALVAGQTDQDHAVNLLDVGQGARCFAMAAADADRMGRLAFADFVKKFESSRSDKQSGAGAGAAGSTSVVAQGPAAKVLSMAAEYGAITQSVSGQVITLRGNLAGLPSALVKHDMFPYCGADVRPNAYCVGGSLLGLLRRVSVSVSLDAARRGQVTGAPSTSNTSTTQPVTFTASRSELSAVSVRAELWNRRDTTSRRFAEQWATQVGVAMDQAGNDLIADAGQFAEDVRGAPGYDAWFAKHLALVRAAGRNRAPVVAELREALRELVVIAQAAVPDFQDHAERAGAAYNRFFLTQDDLIASLATRNVIALEYVSNRPVSQFATTTVRLIADLPLSAQTRLIANGGVTFYDDRVGAAAAGAPRYRDAQVALELSQALGTYSIAGPAVFSLAAYYQYQNAPAILNVDPLNPVPGVNFVGLPAGARTVLATTGEIVLGQAKLTFSPPGSNVKIPAAITYSNRTELVDKPAWRAQVGLAFDFDSLFAGAK